MKLLRKIARLFSINWSLALQYRADLLLWMGAEAATPLISMAVWYTVAKNSGGTTAAQETIGYYMLAILITIITNAWSGFFLSFEILNGNIVQRLIKPISPFWAFIANNLTEKVIRLVIPIPVFIAGLWLFPSIFPPSVHTLSTWPLFLLSLLFAATLAFSMDMIFGLLAFWLEDAVQLRWYKDTLQMITSGVLIPLAVMPEKVQHVINWFPFRHIITTPIEIIMGRLTPEQLVTTLAAQVAWVIAGVFLVYIMWHKGLKQYAPPGQ